MSHTSGKWCFGNYVNAKGQGATPTEITGSGKPYGRLIATLNFDTTDSELSSENVLSNARLICAAPELLEALQTCYNWAKNGNQENLIVFEQAIEAINKATGNHQ